MKPFIGIMERPEKTRGHNDVTVMYDDVRMVVVACGGIPIGIVPPSTTCYVDQKASDVPALTEEEKNDLTRLLDLCSGVIFPGGDEVMDYDLYALDYCYKHQLPTLGICMGMQAMGVYFHGNLKEIHSSCNHRQKKRDYAHEVILDKSSKLYQIMQREIVKVNSFHKYMVTDIERIDVVATAPDGVIEAIEDKKHPFFIGVQWHPETLFSYDIMSQKLFQRFFEIIKKR